MLRKFPLPLVNQTKILAMQLLTFSVGGKLSRLAFLYYISIRSEIRLSTGVDRPVDKFAPALRVGHGNLGSVTRG